jgi:hypothetical protein
MVNDNDNVDLITCSPDAQSQLDGAMQYSSYSANSRNTKNTPIITNQLVLSTISSSRHEGSGIAENLDNSSHGWSDVNAPPGSSRKRFLSHDFPGYGSYDVRATPKAHEMEHILHAMEFEKEEKESEFLQQLEATAISGNDILSSTFYVSGLVTLSAGKLAPVCLAMVGFVLYLFRGIYHETVMVSTNVYYIWHDVQQCTVSGQQNYMHHMFIYMYHIYIHTYNAIRTCAVKRHSYRAHN